jgi:biopolymer transport protein ExbB
MELIAGRRVTGHRSAILLLLAALLAVSLVLLLPHLAAAQEDGQPGPDQSAASAEAAAQPRLLVHIIRSAGPFFGAVLLALSIGLVALIVLLAMELRMPVAIPPAFVEQFTDIVNKRRFREAYDLAKADPSYLAKVLTAGMSRLQYGIEDARDTAYHTVDSVKASKEQLITYLATIGSLGPMLGLVGTVYGMILSFMELSQPGKTPNPQKLADGISHALVITLLGIALAIPAIFFHAFFRNRLIRMSMDTANVADDLLTQIYHNTKRPAGAAVPEKSVPEKA